MADKVPSPWWPWAVAGGLLILGVGGTVVYGKTRGLRNNNPGNIKYDGTHWQGLIGVDSAGFCIFDTAQNGIRALARILLNYQRQHALYTVAAMIGRWAPPSENATGEYVDFVARQMGVTPETYVNVVSDQQLLGTMAKAIITQENGLNPYPDALVATGVLAAQA